MEIRGNKPAQEGNARRFTAGRSALKPEAKSFATSLKQAAIERAAPASDRAAPAPGELSREAASTPATAARSERPAETPSPAVQAPAGLAATDSGPAETDISFADHMEMVRFRLKTGYYASKAIDDALTDKLSGYFDDFS